MKHKTLFVERLTDLHARSAWDKLLTGFPGAPLGQLDPFRSKNKTTK